MSRRLALVLVVVLFATACAEGGDGDDDEGSGEPIGSVTASDTGWSLATDGSVYPPGEHPVRLVNERDEPADFTLYLAEEDTDPSDPPGSDAEVVVEESVAGGEEIVLTVEFATPGDYLSHVNPETLGESDPSSSPESAITIVEE